MAEDRRANAGDNTNGDSKGKWHEWRPPPTARHTVEIIVLAFYVIVDALDIWPHSHFWGVLSAVAMVSVLLVPELSLGRWMVSVAALSMVGVIVYAEAPATTVSPTPQVPTTTAPIPPLPIPGAPRTFEGGPGIPFEDTEVRGALKPASEPTPPNGCDGRPISPDALKVLIGDNAITHDGFGTFTAIGIGTCNALSMERRPDGVFVNASLYDRENGAVVTIRDNKITALNGQNYSARQSGDESRVTIRNAKGVELFYVRFLNPTTVQFRGFLGCSGDAVVWVRENQPVPGFFMRNSCLANARTGIQIGKR
jgi:hypothetical protein